MALADLLRPRHRPRARAVAPRARLIQDEADRRRTQADLGRALDKLAQREAEGGYAVLEIQLLLQVAGTAGYPAFRQAWDDAWRSQGLACSTSGWPASLRERHIVVLLLPLVAGRVGAGIDPHPRVVAEPASITGLPTEGRGHTDVCLGVVTRWASTRRGSTARLAPPVIELVEDGRVVERRVEDFGQAWPLAAPGGV